MASDGKAGNSGRKARTERLEEQLRANLRRRKHQARSRTRFDDGTPREIAPENGASATDEDKSGGSVNTG